jgi:chemotaxis family two-component system response regulator Rcp1
MSRTTVSKPWLSCVTREPSSSLLAPDIILLDLNMPRMDGRELLARIKADDKLKTIPTVILTTSDSQEDIMKSYELHANCYLTKPVQWEAFENLVKHINDFWLIKVRLPQQRMNHQ